MSGEDDLKGEPRQFRGCWVSPALFDLVEQEVISPTEAWMLLNIDSFQRQGRECFISNKELGARAGVGERQAVEHLLRLVKTGLVHRETSKDGKGTRRILTVLPLDEEGGTRNSAYGGGTRNSALTVRGKPRNKLHKNVTRTIKQSGGGEDTPHRTDIARKFVKMAEQLAHAISTVRKVNTTSKISGWARSFLHLHTVDGVPTKRIRRALKWYCTAYPSFNRQPYFPMAESGDAFRKKLSKVEDAMAKPEFGGLPSAGDTGGGESEGPSEPGEIKVTSRVVDLTHTMTLDEVYDDCDGPDATVLDEFVRDETFTPTRSLKLQWLEEFFPEELEKYLKPSERARLDKTETKIKTEGKM